MTMSKSAAFLKRSWPALVVAAVALALGAAALWELAGRQRESVAASAGVTNWGLSFQQEGQPPHGQRHGGLSGPVRQRLLRAH